MARADGYHRLADLMGSRTDLCIFRRFLAPNVLCLLFMQAEITGLLADLRTIVKIDRKSQKPERCNFESDFYALKNSVGTPEGDLQYQTFLELKKKLKEYNEALLQHKEICSLPAVNKPDLETLQDWLRQLDGGHNFLVCDEDLIWHSETEYDLTSLTGRHQDNDPLSEMIDTKVMTWIHETILHRWKKRAMVYDSFTRTQEPTPIHYYSDKQFSRWLSALSIMLSSLLPTVPIFILYCIIPPLVRIGTIMALTFLFSVVLTLTTRIRRVECFIAACTFAAVQVVFVSNNGVNYTAP